MTESTARYALPLIAPGQAQKEMAHNEALAVLDLLVQAGVEAVGIDKPPADPAVGQCWIVGRTPTGAWSGRADTLAGWTGGGWRFVAPRPGMAVSIGSGDGVARYGGGAWTIGVLKGTSLVIGGAQVVGARQAAIAGPTVARRSMPRHGGHWGRS